MRAELEVMCWKASSFPVALQSDEKCLSANASHPYNTGDTRTITSHFFLHLIDNSLDGPLFSQNKLKSRLDTLMMVVWWFLTPPPAMSHTSNTGSLVLFLHLRSQLLLNLSKFKEVGQWRHWNINLLFIITVSKRFEQINKINGLKEKKTTDLELC